LFPFPRKRQDNRIVFESLPKGEASMSILDDAIREHLELKRAHGADESEIKKLEDEAFGPPGRPDEPDPAAEAPTEFMTTPEAAEAGEEGGRRINIADLQEPPEPKPQEEPRIEATESVEPQADAAPLAPAEDPAQAAPPAEEEPPVIVPEAEPELEPADEPIADAGAGHNTEERHAIAEQPTEFFDIEAEMGTEDAPPAEAPSPSDEEIVAAEASEPKLAPVEPPTEIHASRAEPPAVADEEEEDEDFWSEQRLSDELDQALEAPVTDEHEVPAPTSEPPATEAPAQLFGQSEGEDARDDDQPRPDYDPDTGHEDVLEDTPDFLEESPEDDELWFEQKPPKDFDFDD
jgi:hypothetical protein